jgi:2-polyprenyl-6-methoxyphenol hydroxylase-like FAD-dependent oxidoreductase
MDVCIHGAGPVGACLALALSRHGLSVGLVDPRRSPAPAREDLRAYALSPSSVQLLQQLKVWEALPSEARTSVQAMRVQGDSGGRLEFAGAQQGLNELAWIVDAGALERVLAEALRYAPHVQSLGQAAPAGLQAICEGRESATRADLGVKWLRQPYQHTAVAARLIGDQPHDGMAHQWFQQPGVLGLLPFDRPKSGSSWALVWSLPEELARLHLEEDPASFEAALEDATAGAVGRLQLASDRAAWPLVSARAEPVCGEGWVLLGDAAHAMHPLAGQGLNVGLGDVACLAPLLARSHREQPWRSLGDARTLRAYARSRAWPTQSMTTLVDGLWQLFSRPEAPFKELRNQGMSLVNQFSPLKHWLARQAMDDRTTQPNRNPR